MQSIRGFTNLLNGELGTNGVYDDLWFAGLHHPRNASQIEVSSQGAVNRQRISVLARRLG
jgi:hypothetical protein